MNIENPCIVVLTWVLKDTLNQVIDELTDPTEFFFGGVDLLPKVEEALLGHVAGDTLELHLEPEHAFGDYDAKLVFFDQRDKFPEHVEEGMQFEGPPEDSGIDVPRDVIYTVTEVYDEHVVLDGNHPLAGIAIRMEIKVVDVRAATEQEIADQSVSSSVSDLFRVGHPDLEEDGPDAERPRHLH
jgi:FKBP-type peptidyl-prolyl cis-trans isomerase SlyD